MLDSLHILPSCHGRDGGLSAAVKELVTAQRACGISAELAPSDDAPYGRRSSTLLAVAQSSQPRILHSHGLWLSPSYVSRNWRIKGGATVVAPHGMLDPWTWTRHRQIKQLRWRLGEVKTLAKANCLQALCMSEALIMRELGLMNPIAIIPNGVLPPDRSTPLPPPPWHGQVPDDARILLFLGRFHPKKGIQPLLQAWSRLQEQCIGAEAKQPWWLIFVGFDDGDALSLQLKRHPLTRCLVVGPAFGRAKDSAYAHASGFVLPSFSEGLPLAALEAMSWGIPCLLSRHCNLPEALESGAACPADPQPELLADQLQRFCRTSHDEFHAMAHVAQQLVANTFSWSRVAERCRSLYDWILAGGDPPPFLHP